MSRWVCDPAQADVWIESDGHDDRAAAQSFLAASDYDPRDYDPMGSFTLLVRNNAEDEPRKVRVRVVPIHFEVR